jgi:hypothetical protein
VTAEMNERQELLARLDRLQSELVEIDAMVRAVVGGQFAGDGQCDGSHAAGEGCCPRVTYKRRCVSTYPSLMLCLCRSASL